MPIPEEEHRETEHDKLRMEISKMIAESIKLGAETAKINAEIKWYPLVAVASLVIGLAGIIATLVVKLFVR